MYILQDNAINLGLTATQGSYLVGLIGISNTVARVVLGALSQKLNRLFLYNTCLVLCGLTMAASNYFQVSTPLHAITRHYTPLHAITRNYTMV